MSHSKGRLDHVTMNYVSHTFLKPPHVFPQEKVTEAYLHCEVLARKHYENFPVGSILIPKALRPFIHSIYAFARTADDFADEEEASQEVRLHNLNEWQNQLDRCFAGNASHPIFIAIEETVRRFKIPKEPFDDLLTAFRMDVTQNRFETFDHLLYYCRHSANPVGRLVLYVFDEANQHTFSLSDNLCTGLQLANFWQDVSLDLLKDRVYIPLEDFDRFGYTDQELRQGTHDSRFNGLIKFQVSRTRQFFESAKPLLTSVTRRLRVELTLTWLGGMTILRKIQSGGFDTLSRRPTINGIDKARILLTALLRGVA